MRLALAQALFVPQSDRILLDECTNHLDLHGITWLIKYLTTEDKKQERTLMVVSHDREFLDAICTDIVVMEHKRLTYHVGSFSDYQRQMQEKAARQSQILDASERQRSKALAFVQEHQNSKKSTDPNKQRQAKMIRDKKIDRIGNYREDGKRYKQFSLKKLDMAYVQTAQKVQIERDEAVLKLRFPDPTWPPGVPEGSPLVQLDDVSFGYDPERDPLLKHLTINVCRGSKIALVGNNGCGKTTLIRLITGDNQNEGRISGNLWRHPSLRFGHVTQYAVEELEGYASMTVVQYAETVLSSGGVSSTVIKAAAGNVRQYLGGFGLGGDHALRKIGTLSGGERMRLCFATVLADEPHLIFLDESTNHIDLETLDSMAAALRDYQGAVLMVSHNQGFLSTFCKELWVLENGHIDVSHDDTESFDDLFSKYRNHIMATSATTRQNNRQLTLALAKKATSHATGARKGTTLLA
jgi:ATP-binding cassette subfamily F protein 3